jgi:predicted DCC family thiol-disulfide oxidoreductase YuxK
VLYDGSCGFCGWSVRWVLRRDRHRVFRFAPLDSEPARLLLEWHGAAREPGTVMVLDDGSAYTRGDAVLRVLRRLGGVWHLLRVGALVPRPLRNTLYDRVARHRGALGRWFRAAPISDAERRDDERFLA